MKINFNPVPSSYKSFFDWKKPQAKMLALVCIALVGIVIWEIKNIFDTKTKPDSTDTFSDTKTESGSTGASSSSSVATKVSFLKACQSALEGQITTFEPKYVKFCEQSHCQIVRGGAYVDILGDLTTHCTRAQAAEMEKTFRHKYENVWSFDQTNVYKDVLDKYYPANYLTQIARGNIIAAQGPTKQHVFDFLQMLIDVDCQCLVVVADDLGGLKYAPYLNKIVKNKKDKSQTIEVKVDAEEFFSKKAGTLDPFIIKRQIRLIKGGKEHKITQFQLVSWPDSESINPEILHDFVIKIINRYFLEETGILVTHCSAGVGRTGVFAYVFDVIWNLQQRLNKKEFSNPLTQEFLDGKFLSMRKPETGRWPMMIQTAKQYQCALQTILQHVRNQT